MTSKYFNETKGLLATSYTFYLFGAVFSIAGPVLYYDLKKNEFELTSVEYKKKFETAVAFIALGPSLVFVGYLMNLIFGVVALVKYMKDYETFYDNYEFSLDCDFQRNEFLVFVKFKL